MELYETTTGIAKKLAQKANEMHLPLGGTIELTPLCNMNCKMCYVHKTPEEMALDGDLLSFAQWSKILQEAKDNGVLYLLITGGEPLLYPEFKKIYEFILKMGFVVSLNTNATLIDEEWADFFNIHRCSNINITLYGKDDATYKKVCNNEKGFSQVTKAASLLKERNIPFIFTSSLIEENADQLKDLYQLAKDFDVPYKPATYMFPAARRNICAEQQIRMSPEKAAQTMFLYYELSKTPEEMDHFVKSTLANLFLPPRIAIAAEKKGYTCRGGKSGFWITWKGHMTSCAMLEEPQMSLLKHSFIECWNYIVEQTQSTQYCNTCIKCSKQNICHVCPAAVYTETGSSVKCPSYLCAYTHKLIQCLLQYIPEKDREVYEKALDNGGFKQVL